MKQKGLIIFCLVVLAALAGTANAQNAKKNWIFGRRVRIDFNPTTPVTTTLATIDTNEGSSSISDSNGQLLFYTDGIKVWDKNHTQMPNGFGLLGHTSSTHSALIVPCNCNKYFIFTTDAVEHQYQNGLSYSIVDMSLRAGLGDVASKNNFLMPKVAEKLAAISDLSGGFWVVGHTMFTTQFFAYHILAGSDCFLKPNEPTTVSAVGSNYHGGDSNFGYGQGQMKISPDGTMLAVAGLDYGDTSFLELFRFDRTTGVVSHYGPTGSLVRDSNGDMFYGIEFSPNSQKLYVTTIFKNNKLFQYSISPNGLTSKTLIKDYGGNAGDYYVGQLQLAPDGRIYIARPTGNPFSTSPSLQALDALTTPNVGTGGYLSPAITLAANSLSRMGLPTVVAGNFSCMGDPAGGCCDILEVSPSSSPARAIDWRTFQIFNPKQAVSPICSVDIDMQPAPSTPWSGRWAFQNGTTPITNFSPNFQRLPTTGSIPSLSSVSPSLTIPAIQFDLGLNTSFGYNGKVVLTVNHCDGTICLLEYKPWIIPRTWVVSEGTAIGWNLDIEDLGPRVDEFLLTYQGGKAELPRGTKGAKWLGVSLQNERAEIYGIDGPTGATQSDKKFNLRSSTMTKSSALFEFSELLRLSNGDQQRGRTISLLIRNNSGSRINPKQIVLTLYDEMANPITSGLLSP